MLKCSKCGTQILKNSSAYEKGICIPCQEGRNLFKEEKKNIRTFKKHLDLQNVGIIKIRETKTLVEYSIFTEIYDNDPRFRSRRICVGRSTGIYRLTKDKGDVEVVYPLEYDDGKIHLKAKNILKKAYINKDYPKTLGWAFG